MPTAQKYSIKPYSKAKEISYPFGMFERSYSDSIYRFGFNGKERDDEIAGLGNSLNFGARIYDSRLGRWLSLDPLAAKYPNVSAYAGIGNNPIIFFDLDGRDIDDARMKDENGRYFDAYVFFSLTAEASSFASRFSSGEDGVNTCGIGDLKEHTLRFRVSEKYRYDAKKGVYVGDQPRGGREGFASVFLKLNNGKEVRLRNVTAEDVKNSNLIFIFEAVLDVEGWGETDASGAPTIGHEVLLHLQNQLELVEKLLNDIKNGKYLNGNTKELNYEAIAKELNDISKSGGENDHRAIAKREKRAESYLKFLKELKLVLPKEKKDIPDKTLNEETKDYGESN